MRVVVSHAAIKVHRGLEGALAILGADFVDMANIHTSILAVKGHRGLDRSRSGCHGNCVPVVLS
jgi:hypothetical protein